MSDPNDPNSRTVRNPLPRPQMSVQDAISGSGFDARFNEQNLPGAVDESAMLGLLAQNTELRPSGRAPADVREAIQRGTRENPDIPNDGRQEPYERGRVEFDTRDPGYRPAPGVRPDLRTEQPSRDSFVPRDRDEGPRNPNADRRQVPASNSALPAHIREKMASIDRATADPEGYRREVEERAQNSRYPDPNSNSGTDDQYDDQYDSEELDNGFDRDVGTDENGRVTRSPRLPPRRPPGRKPPITNQPNAPRNQPQISEAERAEAIQARGVNAPERQFTPTKPRFVLRRIENKGGFVRFTPTSGGVFYKGADNLQVRKFDLTDAMGIQKAKENQDITALVDVMQSAMGDSYDTRDLTMGDFMQMMYWHRFNSYPSIPFILNWTSKYGNRAQYRLTDTEIQYQTMSISEEDLQPWLDQGYTVPRVRDFEMFSREELTDDEKYLVDRAQYFIGNPREDGLPPDIQDKIDMLAEKSSESLDAISKISEFAKLTEHGVIERVLLKDTLFDKTKHVETLHERFDIIQRGIERLNSKTDEDSVRQMLGLEMEADELEEEIDRWAEEGAAAEVEDVRLNIPLLNFFPSV